MGKLGLWILKAQKPQLPFYKTPLGLKISKFYQSSYKSTARRKEGIKHIYVFCFSFCLVTQIPCTTEKFRQLLK